MSQLPEGLFGDAKLYNKLVLVFFTADNCKICNSLEDNLNKIPIVTKYILVKVNADEYPNYFVRLSRGVIPTLTVLTPDMGIGGVIESSDISFIENVLREIYDSYYNRKSLPTVRISPLEGTPMDFDVQNLVYNVIDNLLNGAPADFRTVELYRFYSKIYPEYQKELRKLNPLDDVAKYLKSGADVNIDDNYAINVALKYLYLGKGGDKVVEFVNSDGSVYRSLRKQMKGLLSDEAIIGSSLISLYQDTFDEKYLKLALSIYDYVKSNLYYGEAYLDSPKTDPITSIPYVDPLANSEFAIFLSRLYLVAGDEKFKHESLNVSKIVMGIAGNNYRIQARVSIAYLKSNYGIKSLKKEEDDIRVERIKELMCEQGYIYQDLNGKCYKGLNEIEFTVF